nr:6-phosphogluconolactonase [uncultured Cetobacterium sp.]
MSKKNDLFKKAVDIFKEKVYGKDRIAVAFSGGKTPKEFYRKLAKEDIAWDKIDIFMVDEKYTALTSVDSNFNLLKKNLLDKIEIPKENIYKIEFLKTPLDSKLDYEKRLLKYFHGNIEFDLVFLGIGEDGHTASIFEVDDALLEEPVIITENQRHEYVRISLSLNTINKAKDKIFLATQEKEKILNDLHRLKYPASLVEDPIYLIEKNTEKS